MLGLIFTGFQAYEYMVADFKIDEGIYPSTFLYGNRVSWCTCNNWFYFLTCLFYKGLSGHFKPENISVLNLQHGIGTLLMSYGYFCLHLYTGGCPFKF